MSDKKWTAPKGCAGEEAHAHLDEDWYQGYDAWQHVDAIKADKSDLLTHLKHCSSLLGAVAGDLENGMDTWTSDYTNNLKKARDEAQALIAKVEG